jgi:GAG-pre-integrase domain
MEWHEKLGHLNEVSLKNMAKNRGPEMKLGKDDKLALCETCIQGKQVQAPFPERKSPRTSDLLEVPK